VATKTITIDDEAYDRLERVKRKDESLSDTIKRVVPIPVDLDTLVKRLRENPFSPEFIDAVEEQVANRSRPSTRER
jgi:predicted CopG family antitoxin